MDPASSRLPVFVENDLQRESEGAFFFESFTREVVRAQAQAGLIGERFVAGLGGGMLVRWDESEPLATSWDRGAVTERVRLQMPVSERQLARSDRNAVIDFGVTRTRKGMLEHCRGLVPLGRYKAPRGLSPGAPLASHPAVMSTLGEIAEKFRLNVAMVSYCEVVDCEGSLGQVVAPHRADVPLAVLLGSAAVRDLKLDIDDLSTRHDVTQFGSRRVPTLLVRFTGPDDLWEQMMSFGRELDQERLAVALGSSSPPTRRN